MPTENFWPEFFHRTCHLSDVCFFLDQSLGFSRLLDFIELKIDFRLRSASSIFRISLEDFPLRGDLNDVLALLSSNLIV